MAACFIFQESHLFESQYGPHTGATKIPHPLQDIRRTTSTSVYHFTAFSRERATLLIIAFLTFFFRFEFQKVSTGALVLYMHMSHLFSRIICTLHDLSARFLNLEVDLNTHRFLCLLVQSSRARIGQICKNLSHSFLLCFGVILKILCVP